MWEWFHRNIISRFAVQPIKPKTKAMDYQHLYDTAVINGQKIHELKEIVTHISEGRMRYEGVAATLANGIPWWFIGITHFMEVGHKYPHQFDYHLHCGDPLTGRTFHVPKNRPDFNPHHGTIPPSKANPYTWEESALDALRFMGYDKVHTWDIGSSLYLFEKFNGMGYNKRGLPSPYLWSYTSHYVKGKYDQDGHYDPELVSKQPGTAAILKMLLA